MGASVMNQLFYTHNCELLVYSQTVLVDADNEWFLLAGSNKGFLIALCES
jgi:hypothetical protein